MAEKKTLESTVNAVANGIMGCGCLLVIGCLMVAMLLLFL